MKRKRGLKILVADDHVLFRQGLRRLFEEEKSISLVEEASDGREAVKKTKEILPDLVLMDLEMPNMGGLEAARAIRQSCPRTGIIVLTMYEDNRYLFEAIKLGVNGYVLKDSSFQTLLENVKAVASGDIVLNPNMAKRILEEFSRLAQVEKAQKDLCQLTKREAEVLRCLADGKSNKQIARDLYISEKTVKNHISSIYHKLHCSDRTQAVLEAMKLGIVEKP